MARLLILAAFFVPAGASASRAQAPLYQLTFGTTAKLPLSGGLPAGDYISNYETAVPEAIRACHARFLAFNNSLTDYAMGAFFEVRSSQHAAVQCIQRRFPQGSVRTIERTPSVEDFLKQARLR